MPGFSLNWPIVEVNTVPDSVADLELARLHKLCKRTRARVRNRLVSFGRWAPHDDVHVGALIRLNETGQAGTGDSECNEKGLSMKRRENGELLPVGSYHFL